MSTIALVKMPGILSSSSNRATASAMKSRPIPLSCSRSLRRYGTIESFDSRLAKGQFSRFSMHTIKIPEQIGHGKGKNAV